MARVAVAELAHHVTQRGNARREVFFSVQDRQVYLGLLQEYSAHYGLRIQGYCLMTNHVHLVAVPERETSLARTLREVHGRYARYRNAIERGSGHVWQNRYYSCAFEGVRWASVMRYVELNPVRAGIVKSPGDYAWSSALMHLGGSDPLSLVDAQAWRREWSPEQWSEWLREGAGEAAAIREATYTGRVFGSEGFVAELERKLERRLVAGKPGRPGKDQTRAAAE